MTEWEVSIKREPWDWFPLGRTWRWGLYREDAPKNKITFEAESGYAFTKKGARRAAERAARRIAKQLEPPETYRYET